MMVFVAFLSTQCLLLACSSLLSLTSESASDIRFTCRVRHANPPKESGLCIPLASPIWHTRSHSAGSGLFLYVGKKPNSTRRNSRSSMSTPWYLKVGTRGETMVVEVLFKERQERSLISVICQVEVVRSTRERRGNGKKCLVLCYVLGFVLPGWCKRVFIRHEVKKIMMALCMRFLSYFFLGRVIFRVLQRQKIE